MLKTKKVEIKNLRLKDLKAKSYLFQAIDCRTLETIHHKKTSKADMEFHEKRSIKGLQEQSGSRALHLEFEALQMRTGESFSDYLS